MRIDNSRAARQRTGKCSTTKPISCHSSHNFCARITSSGESASPRGGLVSPEDGAAVLGCGFPEPRLLRWRFGLRSWSDILGLLPHEILNPCYDLIESPGVQIMPPG